MSKKQKPLEQAELQIRGDYCVTRTPYHRDFVTAARGLGGNWDSSAKEWRFPISQWDLVQELVRRCYPNPIVHTPGELAMLKVRREVLRAQLDDVERRIAVIEAAPLVEVEQRELASKLLHHPPLSLPEPTPAPLEDAEELFDLD